MLAEKRRDEILKMVAECQTVTVPELSQKLNISESTIRRDLEQLDRMHKLVRVHGGATALTMQYVVSDESFADRSEIMSEEKTVIGKYAAELIGPDDFVFIDAGTTTERLIDFINEQDAVYVTNSVGHALKLLRRGFRVIMPGGEMKQKTEAMVGADTVDAIRRFNFTIGFFGANGVSRKTGFTTPEVNEAMVKKMALSHSEARYVLCDHTKFSLVSPITFSDYNEADVITDCLPDQSYTASDNLIIAGE
ncbi:MAG: DeoR/GlpR family DNA-binding transcription regulator [Lachnospiraceae bacterium]|nr:DeoR/GlpR family DNA-binding transcription regulator [Lachnospiraceae bacterium]